MNRSIGELHRFFDFLVKSLNPQSVHRSFCNKCSSEPPKYPSLVQQDECDNTLLAEGSHQIIYSEDCRCHL